MGLELYKGDQLRKDGEVILSMTRKEDLGRCTFCIKRAEWEVERAIPGGQGTATERLCFDCKQERT